MFENNLMITFHTMKKNNVIFSPAINASHLQRLCAKEVFILSCGIPQHLKTPHPKSRAYSYSTWNNTCTEWTNITTTLSCTRLRRTILRGGLFSHLSLNILAPRCRSIIKAVHRHRDHVAWSHSSWMYLGVSDLLHIIITHHLKHYSRKMESVTGSTGPGV